MNKNLLPKISILVVITAGFIFAFSTGPLPSHTGGFGEPDCTECHFDRPVNSGPGTLEIIGVPDQYEPGKVYPITVRIAQRGQRRWGFQIAVRFREGSMRGRQAGRWMLVDATRTRITPGVGQFAGIDYPEHTSLGTFQGTVDGPVEWTINWEAPSTPAGAVEFNAAGNAANGNGSPTGDFIYTTSRISNAPGAAPAVLTHFAQFANGANFVSSLVLTNPSRAETATGSISFFNDQGQPFSVSVNGQPPSSTVSFSIPPLGSATFTTDGAGSLVPGWARVSSSIPIGGVIRFSFPGLGIAGVGESLPLAALMTPVVRDVSRGLNTGVAVSNTQASQVQLQLSLRGLDGRQVSGGSASEMLPGNGHLAKFINELFPNADTASFQGTLVVTATTSGGRIAATAIQIGSSAGEFTTLPVVAVDPATTTRELFFAQFANGSGFRSSLFLTNPLTSAISGDLRFFDDSGNPLTLSIGGQAPSDRLTFNIQGQGGAVFETDGQGGLISGSARVSASNAIGGVLRFAFPSLGIAGVGASQPVSGFITPVTRSVERRLSTGVAVVSVGSAVTLRLTLRNRNGEAAGEATIQLPANGHVARFIEELFPNADTREFDGTLTVVAEGGNVAATAIQIGSRAGEFTTMPVTELR